MINAELLYIVTVRLDYRSVRMSCPCAFGLMFRTFSTMVFAIAYIIKSQVIFSKKISVDCCQSDLCT